MLIMNICDVPNVMEVMRIVNIVITIIKIVVPILLILSVMIDFTRAVMDSELNKITKPMVNKVIAAVVIFLIPTFVRLIAKISSNDGGYENCLRSISKEEISNAYTELANDLVEKSEESLNINDYNSAVIYLMNVKDNDRKKELTDRLDTVKEQIDAINRQNQNSSGYPSVTYGKCDFVEKNAGGMMYALCVPKNYKKQGIPMIVWLHGLGEVGAGFQTLKGSGLVKVIQNWGDTGLADIPAIVVAPCISSGDWGAPSAQKGVKAIMDDVIKNYNVNTKKISLIGHSLGGSGVYYIASANQSYFSNIVMLSGYVSAPSSDVVNYFRNIPMKGYSEASSALRHTTSFFNAIGKSGEVRRLYCGHGEVPKVAVTLDEDKDGISDLIYWMLSSGEKNVTIDDTGKAGTPTVDKGGNTACSTNGKYKSCSPSRGVYGSFPYYDSEPNSTSNRNSLEMDPSWRKQNFTTVSKTCSNGKKMNWTVHVKAKSIWEKVQEKICQITTTGIDGVVYSPDEIIFSGPTVVRFVSNSKTISNHAYGLAIDVNPSNKYTIGNNTFQPYGRNIKTYDDFVKALGNENDTRNINYVLWVKIFKPLGFEWGRYWSGSSFDGMHFEIDWKNAK